MDYDMHYVVIEAVGKSVYMVFDIANAIIEIENQE